MHDVTQRCPRCTRDLPLSCYHAGKRGKAGHYCQACATAYTREWKVRRRLGIRPDVRMIRLSSECRWALSDTGRRHGPNPARPAAVLSQSYRAVHKRIVMTRGRASEQPCQHCSEAAEHWAYDHADPAEVTGLANRPGLIVQYSVDMAHYIPLCRPCHARFDIKDDARRAVAYRHPESPRPQPVTAW